MPAAMCVLGPVLSCDCYAFSGSIVEKQYFSEQAIWNISQQPDTYVLCQFSQILSSFADNLV